MEWQQAEERSALLRGMLEQSLRSQLFDFSDSKVLPNGKGFYLIYDKAKGLIYAGQSRQLRRRLFREHLAGNIGGSHFRKSLLEYLGTASEDEISRYVRNQCAFQYLESDAEYKNLEHFAIALLKPILNNRAQSRFSDMTTVFPKVAMLDGAISNANQYLQKLVDSRSYLIQEVISLPSLHAVAGVYAISMLDHDDNNYYSNVVYVGETFSIADRMKAHANRLLTQRTLTIGFVDKLSAYKVQYIDISDTKERRYLEHYFIAILSPVLNK